MEAVKEKEVTVFVLTETKKDKSKRTVAYKSFSGLDREENFTDASGQPAISRHNFKKQEKEKGSFTYSDYDKHIEIKKVPLITTKRVKK